MNEQVVQMKDGDALRILPETDEFFIECCDCGLRHRIDVKHECDSTVLRFSRETEWCDTYSLAKFIQKGGVFGKASEDEWLRRNGKPFPFHRSYKNSEYPV